MYESQTADALAEAAVAGIESGMMVGLGTGRTASRGVIALAERLRHEQLDIRVVCTSHATESLARFHNLPISEFALVERVDFLFDGADEVDPGLRMLKGSGGAMVRERLVAWASERCVYMIDHTKLVDRLGEHKTLPIAVMAFGLASIRAGLRELGLHGVVRRTITGDLFLTDNGNLVIDVALTETTDLEELCASLNDIPGVAGHGLFLFEADEVLIETADGTVERRARK